MTPLAIIMLVCDDGSFQVINQYYGLTQRSRGLGFIS